MRLLKRPSLPKSNEEALKAKKKPSTPSKKNSWKAKAKPRKEKHSPPKKIKLDQDVTDVSPASSSSSPLPSSGQASLSLASIRSQKTCGAGNGCKAAVVGKSGFYCEEHSYLSAKSQQQLKEEQRAISRAAAQQLAAPNKEERQAAFMELHREQRESPTSRGQSHDASYNNMLAKASKISDAAYTERAANSFNKSYDKKRTQATPKAKLEDVILAIQCNKWKGDTAVRTDAANFSLLLRVGHQAPTWRSWKQAFKSKETCSLAGVLTPDEVQRAIKAFSSDAGWKEANNAPCTLGVCRYAPDRVDKQVKCSHCNLWYHGQCQGLDDPSSEAGMWFCRACDQVLDAGRALELVPSVPDRKDQKAKVVQRKRKAEEAAKAEDEAEAGAEAEAVTEADAEAGVEQKNEMAEFEGSPPTDELEIKAQNIWEMLRQHEKKMKGIVHVAELLQAQVTQADLSIRYLEVKTAMIEEDVSVSPSRKRVELLKINKDQVRWEKQRNTALREVAAAAPTEAANPN